MKLRRIDHNVRYSRYDELPSGRAEGPVTEGCLVLEGGAFRGVYTGGVQDALMENGINLSCTVGVSAGAMNGITYAAGQIGYASRINLGYRHDRRYVGSTAISHDRGIIGFDFAFSGPDGMEPLDVGRIKEDGRRFVAVATNCLTGKEEYFEADGTRSILKAVRASASMPYLSRMVYIDGVPYLDGGCACKIPYRWALEQGFRKIIIVRTREPEYRKEVSSHKRRLTASRLVYHHFPKFEEALNNSAENYNEQCREIEALYASGRICRIAPDGPVEISRLEGDMEKLGDLYHRGYNDVIGHLGEIRRYLES